MALADIPALDGLKLTEWTSCGGCAAKWGAALLKDLVADFPVAFASVFPVVLAAAFPVAFTPDFAVVFATAFPAVFTVVLALVFVVVFTCGSRWA